MLSQTLPRTVQVLTKDRSFNHVASDCRKCTSTIPWDYRRLLIVVLKI